VHADEIGSRGRECGDGGGADAALIVAVVVKAKEETVMEE